MRCVVALLTIAFLIDGARLASASEAYGEELAVTIQIHDYAGVSAKALSRACAVVSRIYANIEVRTDWIGVVRFDKRRKPLPGQETPRSVAQFTLNILTMKMVDRHRVGDFVLGYVAVSTEGMGRIAYVINDRVEDTAAQVPMNKGDLLGFVMAHEIGHLLLPHGSASQPHDSHTLTGLMRGRWDVTDFVRLDVRTLSFPQAQARQIRDAIENESSAVAARAETAGKPGGHAGLTSSPDGSTVGRMRWIGMR
jgi:hypothetical protein